jgi:hypothetical protein
MPDLKKHWPGSFSRSAPDLFAGIVDEKTLMPLKADLAEKNGRATACLARAWLASSPDRRNGPSITVYSRSLSLVM